MPSPSSAETSRILTTTGFRVSLKGVVKFRSRMHWPKTARPLGLLPLCQATYNNECEKWLRSLILEFRHLSPSCHVPKNSLRGSPSKHEEVSSQLSQCWEETMWSPGVSLD